MNGVYVGFIKDSFRVINCLVTLGGSEELIDSREAYEELYVKYKPLHEYLQSIQEKIDHNLSLLGESLIQAKKTLKKAESILKDPSLPIQLSTLKSQSVIEKVHNFNSSYSNVMNVGFGGLAGGTLALGAWAVVSVVGSASTGTAIAGLSGVAATNATLAWFGGGALAAGGAGMSGGMMVLGGIVAAPMVYFAAKGSYAKAEKVKDETKKLEIEYQKLLGLKSSCESNLEEIKIIVEKIVALTNNFTETVEQEYRVIRPYGLFSYFRQQLSSLFDLEIHTEFSKQSIKSLAMVTNHFLESFSEIKR